MDRRQHRRDPFGGPVREAKSPAELVRLLGEVGAHGAALLAGVGAGAWSDVASACKACIRITGSTLPVEKEAQAYRKSYAVYRELYPALKSKFEKS